MGPGEGGARQSQLINWYLKEIEAELDSVEEVKSKKLLVEKIVERLVQKVSVWACGMGRVSPQALFMFGRITCWFLSWEMKRRIRKTPS